MVGTELFQEEDISHLTGLIAGFTAFFVAFIATVKISIADLLSSYPETAHVLLALLRLALVVTLVLVPVVAARLVTLVQTVDTLVAAVVLGDAVGGVELVRATRELPSLTVRRS